MATSKRTPMRMCVGCRELKEKSGMFRVLLTRDGELVIDRTGKTDGRGAYLCKDKECLEKAAGNHGLDRSFRTKLPEEAVQSLLKEMSELAE